MKKLTIILFLLSSVASYSKIKVSVFKNMRFENMNSTNLKRSIVGKGILEIQSDEEDFGKIIELTFVDQSIMTNGRHSVIIKKIQPEEKYREKFAIDSKILHIEFTGVLNQRRIKRGINDELIEGEYVGGLPIRMTVYEKGSFKIVAEKKEGEK